MHLSIDQPLDLKSSLESGQAFRWRCVDGWHLGIIYGNIVKIRQGPSGLDFFSHPSSEHDMISNIADYLRLDDPIDSIYDAIIKDDLMAQVVNTHKGLRILRQEPWECLVSFICSATSNIPRISATLEALANQLGAPLSLQNEIAYDFPNAEVFANVEESFLRQLGMGFRAKYLYRACRMVTDGQIPINEMRRMLYQDAKDQLMVIPGVGEKIADCTLLFSMDKLQAFPIDRWVKRAVEEWYFDGEIMRIEDIRKWALEYFGDYAGYAQQYLFHSKRLQGKKAT